ncbi:hypothetical protein [Aestuariivirga sp.]|uniref:hypothetical protein n=1 Tax=Aestuariivirga sp. TaxID=2650926 RepID=UPI0039E24F45
MKRYQTHTTQDQFEEMHRRLDKTKRTSATVNVPREALTNLLMDHSNMMKECGAV